MYKKAQMNKVFIFLVSFVIVGFVGFLVVGFVSGFQNDVKERVDSTFYQTFDAVINEVSQNWAMEKDQKFRFSPDVTYVCLMDLSNSCSALEKEPFNTTDFDNDAIDALVTSGTQLALFTENGIKKSWKIEDSFIVKDGCTCFKPVDNRISFSFVNDKNKVYIDKSFE